VRGSSTREMGFFDFYEFIKIIAFKKMIL